MVAAAAAVVGQRPEQRPVALPRPSLRLRVRFFSSLPSPYFGVFGKNDFRSLVLSFNCGSDFSRSSFGELKSVAVGDCQLEIAVACFFAAASKFASSRDAIRSARSLALSSRRCAAVTAFLGSLPLGAGLSLLAGTTSEGLRSGTTPEGVTAMTFGCGVRCQRVDHQASDTRAQIKRAVAATNERLNARRGLSARACARFQVAANLGM